MIFSAGDSRTSSTFALYDTPSTSRREPLSDFCAPWFSACEIRDRQK